jgi:hypothetical protein
MSQTLTTTTTTALNTAQIRRAIRPGSGHNARNHSSISRLEPVRTALIHRIRAQIAAGTYETDAKMDDAIDRLVDSL